MLGDNQHIFTISSSLWPAHNDYLLDLWSSEATPPRTLWTVLSWNGVQVEGEEDDWRERERGRDEGREKKDKTGRQWMEVKREENDERPEWSQMIRLFRPTQCGTKLLLGINHT